MRILSSRRCASTAVALVGALLIASYPAPGHAVLEIVAQEQGSDVVFNASGTLDLSALTKGATFSNCCGVIDPNGPLAPFLCVGPDAANPVPVCEGYAGSINGPASFGFGTSYVLPTSGGTTQVGLFTNASQIVVPGGYTSGNSLSGSMTYSEQSFSSLGLTPGAYTWTWGSGSNQDSIVLKIGAAPIAVPTLNEWAMILLSMFLSGSGVIILRKSSRIS